MMNFHRSFFLQSTVLFVTDFVFSPEKFLRSWVFGASLFLNYESENLAHLHLYFSAKEILYIPCKFYFYFQTKKREREYYSKSGSLSK